MGEASCLFARLAIARNTCLMKLEAYQVYSWRSDAGVPQFVDEGHLTVMDAKCGICAKGARWIARADTAEQFRIIPQQSALGAALLVHFGMDPDDPVSWLYLANGRASSSLDGMIRAGAQLGGVWRALIILRILPRGVQDWLYMRLARNRYRLFGAGDLCAMPDPDVQKRLLQ